MFLRKNGELILTANEGIYALNPDSTVAWKIDSRDLGSGRWFGHHEVVELPNGHMLLPGFIEKTRQEAIDAGFDVIGADGCVTKDNPPNQLPDLSKLRVDNIWELAPVDPNCGFKCGWEVVWRWNLWDHIVQNKDMAKPNYVANLADYPGKADIGYVRSGGRHMRKLHPGGLDLRPIQCAGLPSRAERDSHQQIADERSLDHQSRCVDRAGDRFSGRIALPLGKSLCLRHRCTL